MSDTPFWHAGLTVWRKISGNPDLLTGATFGDFEDLVTLITHILTLPARRDVPLGLVIRMTAEDPSTEETFDTIRELLRVSSVKQAIDDLERQDRGEER